MEKDPVYYPLRPLPAFMHVDEDGIKWLRIYNNSGFGYFYQDFTLDKKGIDKNNHFGTKAYLHAIPRAFAKSGDGLEIGLRNAIISEFESRAWNGDNKPRSTKNSKGCSVRDRKKVYAVKGKAAQLFNFLYKQLVRETAYEPALRMAYRFPPSMRYNIYKLCCKHERFLQICESFPLIAAQIAIVKPFVLEDLSFDATDLLDSVLDGVPLKTICKQYNIPYHYRKVRPQNTCLDSYLVDDKDIFDAMPIKTLLQSRYIKACYALYGYDAEKLRRWFVRNIDLSSKIDKLLVDATHVRDYCLHTNQALNCSWKTALERADEWTRELNRRRAQEQLLADEKRRAEFEQPFPEQWIPNAEVDEYTIEYLTNEQSLIDEGQAMSHCVASYAWNCRNGGCQIYSVKKNGERVGTLELSKRDQYYQINQFRSKHNSNPTQAAKMASIKWLENYVNTIKNTKIGVFPGFYRNDVAAE